MYLKEPERGKAVKQQFLHAVHHADTVCLHAGSMQVLPTLHHNHTQSPIMYSCCGFDGLELPVAASSSVKTLSRICSVQVP